MRTVRGATPTSATRATIEDGGSTTARSTFTVEPMITTLATVAGPMG